MTLSWTEFKVGRVMRTNPSSLDSDSDSIRYFNHVLILSDSALSQAFELFGRVDLRKHGNANHDSFSLLSFYVYQSHIQVEMKGESEQFPEVIIISYIINE
jgi:hypothetical protein